MISLFISILICTVAVETAHFNGGTITWFPVDPYTNSTTVVVTIVQSYSWTLSKVNCAPNVPISTPSRTDQNRNLTCVGDCTYEGSYASSPMDILTDCISSSSSMDIMKSQRAKNVTLDVGSYFTIAYRDSLWRSLNNSLSSDWSIVCSIDLRRRPDGIINTPPVASVASPQYVIVNKTTEIKIPVYDINSGDDVRCRWSTNPRSNLSNIDECAGVCYSTKMPAGTTLSNCTLTFTATSSNTWYAVAIQVEDFLDTTSMDAMSSIPVQFLIYVPPFPSCTIIPVIIPFTECLEVQVNVPITLTLYAINYCNKTRTILTDISVTMSINGMNSSHLFNSTTNSSLSYITLDWTASDSQLGLQHFCAIAYTNELVQSEEYCVAFNVTLSNSLCATTTTTVTTTTITTTTVTTTTITTTSITTTTRTTTTVTTTTLTTTQSTSSTTTTTTTTSTFTTTTTVTTQTSTTTTTTTVTFTTTTTTTTTQSVTTSTITTTTTTVTETTTTVTSVVSTMQTTMTTTMGTKHTDIPLIVGLSLLALLLGLCFCCWCYYCYWSMAARRRRRQQHKDANKIEHRKYLLDIRKDTPTSYQMALAPKRSGISDNVFTRSVDTPIERVSISTTNGRKTPSIRIVRKSHAEKPTEQGNALIKQKTLSESRCSIEKRSKQGSSTFSVTPLNRVSTVIDTTQNDYINGDQHSRSLTLSRNTFGASAISKLTISNYHGPKRARRFSSVTVRKVKKSAKINKSKSFNSRNQIDIFGNE